MGTPVVDQTTPVGRAMETAPASLSARTGKAPAGGTGEPRSREELYEALQIDGQRLAAGLIRLLHRMSAHSELNPTDFQCYSLLKVGGPMTPGQIAEGLCLATGSVTGVIDRLEQRGLVERARHPEDRRKVVVRLRAGEPDLPQDTSPGMREAMTALHEGYSAAELEIIADWLGRVGTALDEVASHSRRPRD